MSNKSISINFSISSLLILSLLTKPIPNVLTNYEKQYQKEGRPIYYLDATFEN